jgi:hypothetical protein
MLSTGFSVELHYCMGRFVGINFHSSQNEKCARCGMTEKKGGCCNDEVKFFKLADNFKNNNSTLSSIEYKAILPTTQLEIPLVAPYLISFSTIHLPLNPEQYGPPLFVRNRVFRI